MDLYLHSPNTYSWRGTSLSTGTALPLLLYNCSERVMKQIHLHSETGPYADLTVVFNWSSEGCMKNLRVKICYGLDDRGSRVRFLAGAGNFSLHHRVQNGSGVHPASYPMGTRGSFPGGKAAGA
jgi:hypothetical protein